MMYKREYKKPLSGSKYVFLNYLKGDIYAWLTNNTNYKNQSKKDPLLKDLTPWRWESVNLPWGKQLPWSKLPTQMIDGLMAGEYVKEHYKNLFPNYKFFDVDEDEKNWNKKHLYTEDAIKQNENVILFEPCFLHERDGVKFRIKIDVLIKTKDFIKVVEVKAIKMPQIYHAIDIKYQKEILRLCGYDVDSDNFKFVLGAMSNGITTKSNNPLESVDILFKEFEQCLLTKTTTSRMEELFLEGKGILISDFLDSEKFDKIPRIEAEVIEAFSDFGATLDKLIEIQRKDVPPFSSQLEVRNFKYMDSDYDPWILKHFGANVEGSIFEFTGDTGFSKLHKITLFNQGVRKMKDIPKISLISSLGNKKANFSKFINDLQVLSDEGELPGLLLDKYKQNMESLWTHGVVEEVFSSSLPFSEFFANEMKNGKKDFEEKHQDILEKYNKYRSVIDPIKELSPSKIKRVIQKDYESVEEPFIAKENFLKKLMEYDVNVPIVMYDFETISTAIPFIKDSDTYEQMPYQFSIHVITNPKDYDWESGKNVIHYEWLAESREDVNENFWKAFCDVFSKYPNSLPVSFNKSFELEIISSLFKKPKDISWLSEANKEILDYIADHTIDLMDIFRKKYYYHNDLKGSFSIKKIAPHMAPALNYDDLSPMVRKGDQSALQAKIWLSSLDDKFDSNGNKIDEDFYKSIHDKSDSKWKNIRKPMLEYCKYDTLVMVAILQKLQKLREKL